MKQTVKPLFPVLMCTIVKLYSTFLSIKGLQINIEHWDKHWNIEKIDIDIDIE